MSPILFSRGLLVVLLPLLGTGCYSTRTYPDVPFEVLAKVIAESSWAQHGDVDATPTKIEVGHTRGEPFSGLVAISTLGTLIVFPQHRRIVARPLADGGSTLEVRVLDHYQALLLLPVVIPNEYAENLIIEGIEKMVSERIHPRR